MVFRLIALLLVLASPVRAHFTEGTHVREIVARPAPDGADVWVRAPLPLIFADEIHAAQAEGRALASPYLYSEAAGAATRYRFDTGALEAAPEAFVARLRAALIFARGAERMAAEVTDMRVLTRRPAGAFDSAEAAEAALDGVHSTLDPVFGEGVVAYRLRLSGGAGDGPMTVVSGYPELVLAEGVTVDNHLVRAGAGAKAVTGQLGAPVTFPQGAVGTFAAFLTGGLSHIVTGWDHVLLVMCFAIGLGWSPLLLWVVTAFTLGHSVTLFMGAMGIVPRIAWFIPVVEIAIAATIVLAAFDAWRRRGRKGQGQRAIAMAAGIGLIHGFGFASFLSETLSPETPSFLSALLGFNVGLEVGQIALVLATVAVFAAIGRLAAPAMRPAQGAVLAGIAAVALYWTAERALGLLVA